MNKIKVTPLYKKSINGNNLKSNDIIININPVTTITPMLLYSIDPTLNLKDLYGFNANIACDSKATIIIDDFNYFTLATYSNSDALLSNVKIYNIKDFCRLNNLKMKRIDIENAHTLFVDCKINEIYVGIESYHSNNKKLNTENKYKDIDLRTCRITNLSIYDENKQINIQDTKIDKMELKNNTNDIKIWEYSEIKNMLLSHTIDKISISDSTINFLKGTRNLAIEEYFNEYSVISHVNEIFESNVKSQNKESFELIRNSYLNIRNFDKYSHFSYLINNILLKNEKKLSTKIAMYILKKSCGYGYKLHNAIIFSIFIILLFSLLYFLLPYFGVGIIGINISSDLSFFEKFLQSVYHSIVTFTTLGYGDTIGIDWITKYLSGFESLIGIYSMSIIVYTMTKKYIINN